MDRLNMNSGYRPANGICPECKTPISLMFFCDCNPHPNSKLIESES